MTCNIHNPVLIYPCGGFVRPKKPVAHKVAGFCVSSYSDRSDQCESIAGWSHLSSGINMALNQKQRRFVDEYLIDLNATQAAIRAGYSAKTAEQQGFQLLKKTSVAEAVALRIKDRERRTEITQDRVLQELAKIGFADIRKAVKWGADIPVVNPETGEALSANGVILISSDDIDDDTACAVSEISQTAQGVKIKMHDKKGALVDIGKHLGMFVDRVDATVTTRSLDPIPDDEFLG